MDIIEATEMRKKHLEDENWSGGVGCILSNRSKIPLEEILTNPNIVTVVFKKAVHPTIRKVLEGVSIDVYDCVDSDEELNSLISRLSTDDFKIMTRSEWLKNESA